MVCKKLIDYLVATLSANEALTDMTVITEFPSKRQDLPLENAVVSVGLEGVGRKAAPGRREKSCARAG